MSSDLVNAYKACASQMRGMDMEQLSAYLKTPQPSIQNLLSNIYMGSYPCITGTFSLLSTRDFQGVFGIAFFSDILFCMNSGSMEADLVSKAKRMVDALDALTGEPLTLQQHTELVLIIDEYAAFFLAYQRFFLQHKLAAMKRASDGGAPSGS